MESIANNSSVSKWRTEERSPEFNPFKYAARKLKSGGFKFERNPYVAYLGIMECLKSFKVAGLKQKARISFESASLIARLMLLGKPLSFVTYICVSDYIGGTRFKIQKGKYELTSGELLMLERVALLKETTAGFGVECDWRLILADGWGMDLFGERCVAGSLDLYCKFMVGELERRGFEAVRWSELMSKHESLYKRGCEEAESFADKLAPWEARRGEVGHDRPDKANALSIAKKHIQMRAAEGRVILEEYGPTIVLSAETKRLARYDNLIVPREDYAHVFCMPFYPHRLP